MAKVVPIKNIDELIILKSDEKILDYSTSYLTAPGDNYGSVMLQLCVTTTKQTHNFVAKLPPSGQELWEAFDVPVSFKKESNMYAKIVPLLQNFLNDNSIGNDNMVKLFPYFYSMRFNANKTENVDEDAILIMENLKLSNFKCMERLCGFNHNQTIKIIKLLAELQATVNALMKRRPEEYERVVKPNLIRNQRIDYAPSLLKTFRALRKIYKLSETEFQNLETHLQKGLFEFQRNDLNTHLNENFCTLVHYDFWINNIMWNETTEHVKIVDFQMMQVGSCAYDLLFFLFTSVNNDIVRTCFDEYIQIYFETFVETLQKLKVDTKKYCFDEFYNEIKVSTPEVALHAFLMSPIICSEKGVAVNFDPDADFIINPYYEHKCKTILFLLIDKKLITI